MQINQHNALVLLLLFGNLIPQIFNKSCWQGNYVSYNYRSFRGIKKLAKPRRVSQLAKVVIRDFYKSFSGVNSFITSIRITLALVPRIVGLSISFEPEWKHL